MTEEQHLIEIKDLCKHFHLSRGRVLKAVDGVNLRIAKGEVVGLVGNPDAAKPPWAGWS